MATELKLKDFFETDMKPYSIYDSARSIASVIDGQKITARKVLYTCIKDNITSDFKVAQLQSRVAFLTHYHHGEAGIGGVICNMAQDFAGANNMPLLQPIGQFGSRLCSTPAATRYIFSKMSKCVRQLFKKEDDLILQHLFDDDEEIEPNYYLPILPVVLINGSQGIGTGFASKVLSYRPEDLRQDLLAILKGKKRKPLVPWFNKFNGTIEAGEGAQWVITGKLEVTNTTTIRITELPIGTYLDDIKKTLSKLKERELIRDYDDNSDEDAFNIEVTVPRSTTALPIEKLYDLFKLVSRESENLTLWNGEGKLQVFENTAAIIEYFAKFRLGKYEERRLALIKLVEEMVLALDERIRFIQFYLKNSKMFAETPKKELMMILSTNEFTVPETLLGMPIYNLTYDKIIEMNKELEKKLVELEALKIDTAQAMYARELTELKL